eukprot:CAMPEP_0202116258 /NCGR_PEP_ID=MMETSP0965-20130614/40193_1 /ASSEMBLY_ACC=CAM_ASM_000507 /TAXON_ID=4773 /ORGANISM="Schizochytrium aggregatum, Strain ATCC28209" /LENGTH=50 /DNA_ID=CAMNT_0048686109 /DNA_START=1 /DNA_END=153 /DNA_ORIENTATION=-
MDAVMAHLDRVAAAHAADADAADVEANVLLAEVERMAAEWAVAQLRPSPA